MTQVIDSRFESIKCTSENNILYCPLKMAGLIVILVNFTYALPREML